jgi:DNA polymerase eta
MTYKFFVSFVISRNLGGKLGASVIEILGVEYMGELTQFTESQLQNHFGEKNG